MIEQLNPYIEAFFYIVICVSLFEQLLFHFDFSFAYRYGVKLKNLPIEELTLLENETILNHIKFTKTKGVALIRFYLPLDGIIPLPFVGVVKETDNKVLTVKTGIATLIAVPMLVLTPLYNNGASGAVASLAIAILFLAVYLIFVRYVKETIRL